MLDVEGREGEARVQIARAELSMLPEGIDRGDDPADRLQGVLAFGTLAAQGAEQARARGAAASTTPAAPEKRKKQGRRRTFPGHLPRIRTTFRLPT